MNILDRARQIIGIDKQSNSMGDNIDGKSFLKYGGRKVMDLDIAKVRMSDAEFYTGYSYAAINNRANKTSQLALSSLKTEAAQSIMDVAKKNRELVLHPYLKLIQDSNEFSENEFWYEISTYLDLEGVYYLMAVRTVAGDVVGDIQYFKLLNPYDINRVVNKETFEVGGYIETRDGQQRVIPRQEIIEVRKLNPFNRNNTYSMTDAAKESQFALKQAGDYTRHSLKNNMAAPGIISTDVLLDPEMFTNFVSRVTNQEKGLPLFGNGAGSIAWDSMQIDMDKAALGEINEINRSTLFAVSGMSKTTMGIEESGTTRDTSKVQKDKLIEDHIMPQLQMIIDAFNLDYKRYYASEYKKTQFRIIIDNPLGVDKDTEIKDIEIANDSYKLYDSLIADGYDRDIASKYASGEISLEELGEPTNDPRPNPIIEAAMLRAGQTPQNGNVAPPSESEAGSSQGFLDHSHDHEVEYKQDLIEVSNSLSDETNNAISQQQASLQNTITNIENRAVSSMIDRIAKINNAFDSQSDVIKQSEKNEYEKDLAMAIAAYYLVLFPIYGQQLTSKRASEFGTLVSFKMSKTIEKYIKSNANKAAKSHINTIVDDILKAAKNSYDEAVEDIASALKAAGDTPADEIYALARKQALEGASQQRIISNITKKYQDISKDRAKTIARTETNRAFTQSQYQADIQFLDESGMIETAYKQWQTRSDNPCPYCLELASRPPIPFTQNFEDLGGELSYVYTKKDGTKVVRKLPINYEALSAGNAHVNCACRYVLVIK